MLMKQNKTKNKPFINLSLNRCKIEIKGPSYSEDIDDIYAEVIKWMQDNIPKMKCELICEFHFNILNSVSHKNLLQIFFLLSEFSEKGKKMKIVWFADKNDEDILELADDISELFNLQFNVIEK